MRRAAVQPKAPSSICIECFRLEAERDQRARVFALAVALMNFVAAASGGCHDNHVRLRAETQEAKVDFELADIKLRQHQNRHLVT